MTCDACSNTGGELLWNSDLCRVVLVDDPDYPGFCRVILNQHIKEMTDLDANHQIMLMQSVFAVEAAVREALNPDKINLGSLGNKTPHVHWHVIPRFLDDPHFPESIWSSRQRDRTVRELNIARLKSTIEKHLAHIQ